MCLFFYQFTSYLPNQVSRWQIIVLESMVPLIAWHSAQTYPTLTAPVLSASGHLSVRDQNKRRNQADHQRATALLWTLRPRPPLPPPHPCRAKGPNDHLFVLCEHSRLARAAPLRMQRCTGRSAIIRRLIVISKRQIFPFRVRIGK